MSEQKRGDNGVLVIFFLTMFIFMIAYYILFFINISVAGANEGLAGANKGNCYDHVVIVVYAIALGILGMYSAHNSLEIYKRKESFDKDLRDLMSKHQESITKYEKEYQRQLNDYKELGITLKEKHLNAIKEKEERLGIKLGEIQKEFVGYSQRVKDELIKDIESLESKYEEINKKIDNSIGRIDDLVKKSDNLHYSGIIKKHLKDFRCEDEKEIMAALAWYSENGNDNDLEILEKILKKIPAEQKDLKKVCELAINKIRYSLVREV